MSPHQLVQKEQVLKVPYSNCFLFYISPWGLTVALGKDAGAENRTYSFLWLLASRIYTSVPDGERILTC